VIDASAELFQPVGHASMAAPDGFGEPVQQIPNHFREEHYHRHEHADAGDDDQTAEKEVEERQSEHVPTLTERAAGTEEHCQRARHRKKQNRCHEAHERRGDRYRQRHSIPSHRVDGGRTGPGVEGRDIACPGTHAACQDEPLQWGPGIDVPSHYPEPKSAADPVE
jgi:hypothetical protein